MASQAPINLPLLYGGLEPIQRAAHGELRYHPLDRLPQLASVHAIPLTVDEFALAQRNYPIIFSSGSDPVPLALMGLHEGTNTFFGQDGQLNDLAAYVPAYIRRYPFLLARLTEDSDQLSLCFDPSSGAVSDKDGGFAMFDGDKPSEQISGILQFCEQFEQAGQRTGAFMTELTASGLLMEGEVAIQPEGSEQPFVYRGFQMIDEEKLRNLRGDELRKLNQNGMLGMIMAHLFSLALVRNIFSRQVEQGTGPKGLFAPETKPATADA